jgi:hypothetical protein
MDSIAGKQGSIQVKLLAIHTELLEWDVSRELKKTEESKCKQKQDLLKILIFYYSTDLKTMHLLKQHQRLPSMLP